MTSKSIIHTEDGAAIQGNVNATTFSGRDSYITNISQVLQERPTFCFLNVPTLPPHFVGRDELIGQLVAALCNGQRGLALSTAGVAGVGKTTLAVALARHPQVISHFEGVLWGGLGRLPDTASIQASWADAVRAKIDDLLDPYARSQRISNAIGNRRLLLVIDDAWDLEVAQQLRCSAPQVVHLLTTRNQELARQFAGAQQSQPVPMLTAEASVDLLRQLAPEAHASDPAALRNLAVRVDGLPLALELLGGYLGASSQRRTQQRRQQAIQTLNDPAVRLALATQRLGDPNRQTVSLQQTIALSLEELPSAMVTAFYRLGAFAAKPARFDLAAALAVSQASEEALFALADRHLLDLDSPANGAESLSLHQTLADLAATQTPAEAIQRHREHYLAIVAEDKEDWQRIEAIYPQISVAWSRLDKEDTDAIRFVDNLSTYQRRRGVWQDRLAWLGLAQTVAAQTENKKAEARMLNNIGYVYDALGEKRKALALYEQALPLRRQVGDVRGEASTLNNIGYVYNALDEKGKALALYEQALPLWRQVGDVGGEATKLNNIGLVYDALGENRKALALYEQALPLCRQVGDVGGEASTLNNIGGVYDALGENRKALALYEQALPLWRQVGDVGGEASTLNNIGGVYDALGEKRKALALYEQALPLWRQVGDVGDEAGTLTSIGAVYDALGEKRKALALYKQALPLLRQVGNVGGEGTTLHNIGGVYADLDENETAQQYFEQALVLRIQVGDRFGEISTRWWIAVLQQRQGQVAEAIQELEKAWHLATSVQSPKAAAIEEMLEEWRRT